MDLVGIEKSAAIRIEPDGRMSSGEFFDFCQANSNWRIERAANGKIIIMPPVGLDSGNHEIEVASQLLSWAKRDRRGNAYGPNTGFELPNGAMLAPDAAWISLQQIAVLTPEQRRKFAPLCPEFIIEVKSRSDSVRALRRKMQEWIVNGAELAWLTLPDTKVIEVYRQGRAPETVKGVSTLTGEGPVAGFELDLSDIWPTH